MIGNVRITLPGNDRIMDAKVQVNANKIIGLKASPSTYVCYGVQALVSTQTRPEYIISNDPQDPIFYSSCFVRNQIITFLPPPIPDIPMPCKLLTVYNFKFVIF